MDMDGQITTSLHWIYRKLPTGRQILKFWNTQQSQHESVQEWEVKVRQAGSLCSYNALTDEMCRDKLVFGLHDGTMRAELLKTHLKSYGAPKNMQDVVAEAKALESAQKANKLITDATKGIEEQVYWISHKQMKLKREPGTCFWCGDRRGPHPWKTCPANGKTCTKCGINDHFSRVCLETGPPQQEQPRKPIQFQASGRGRDYRTPHGRSQPRPPRDQSIRLRPGTRTRLIKPPTFFIFSKKGGCWPVSYT